VLQVPERCKHGIDRRFCSRCSGAVTSREPSRPLTQAPYSVGGTDSETIRLDDIVAYLNAAQVRATYGAVAELVGGIAQSIGARLGGLAGRRKEASWVVNAKTGMPSNYPPEHLHPALTRSRDIIVEGDDLRRRLAEWNAAGAPNRPVAVAVPPERPPLPGSEPQRAPSLSVNDLADLRRKLTALLNSFDASGAQGEGIRKRINRLSHDGGPVPRAIAALMTTITEMRNSAEYESKVLSTAECAVVRHAWQAIQEWAASARRA
jgi:alkylated DNA nucleotide flippase Atl1